MISNVQVTNVQRTSAQVSWTTDVESTSQVFFTDGDGPLSAAAPEDTALTTSHVVQLNGLRPADTFRIYVASRAANGAAANTRSKPITVTTAAVDSAGPLDYGIALSGPTTVFAGSDLYLILHSTLYSGQPQHLYLYSSGLPASIAFQPVCRLRNPDGKTVECLTDAKGVPFIWYGADNRAEPTAIRLKTSPATEPGTYSVTVQTRVGDVMRETSFSFTVEAAPSAPVRQQVASAPPVPGQSKWESTMLQLGKKWCVAGETMLFGYEAQVWYYDGGRVYQQIADYTGDPAWLSCAQNIVDQYRAFVLSRNGGVAGWRIFVDGLLMNAVRDDNGDSRRAIDLIAQNSSYAGTGGNPDPVFMRETAYILKAYVASAQLSGNKPYLLDRTVDFLIGQLHQVIAPDANVLHQTFYDGLALEALISYYSYSGDPRVPVVVKRVLDWLWDHKNADYKLVYNPLDVPASHTSVMTNLIMPAFGWYWSVTGDPVYLDRGDALFSHALDEDISYSGKIFSQNYRWSMDYIRWRSGGKLSYTHPNSNAPAGCSAPPSIGFNPLEGALEWTTATPATSQVFYRETDSQQTSTPVNLSPELSHRVTVPLLPGSTYQMVVKSWDERGNVCSSPLSVMAPPVELPVASATAPQSLYNQALTQIVPGVFRK